MHTRPETHQAWRNIPLNAESTRWRAGPHARHGHRDARGR